MFQPPNSSYQPRVRWLRFAESAHGKIAYRTFEPDEGHSPRCVVLFTHGNACDIGTPSVSGPAKMIADVLSARTFVFDYCGYGQSPSDGPSVPCTEVSAAAVFRVASSDATQLSVPLLLVGHSLGSAVAISLAAEMLTHKEPHRIAGMLLLCPFVTPLGVWWHALKMLRSAYHFDNIKLLESCAEHNLPVFFVGSSKDTVIDFDDTKQLFKTYAGSEKRLMDAQPASHMSILTKRHLEPIVRAFGDWLHIEAPPPQPSEQHHVGAARAELDLPPVGALEISAEARAALDEFALLLEIGEQ